MTRQACVAFVLLLAGASVSSILQAQPSDAPTWRIESVAKRGFSPHVRRDKTGKPTFDGGKPLGIMDAAGRTKLYSVDAGSRMVLEVSGGARRFWDRYLWVTVRFSEAPAKRSRDLVIVDKDDNKVGFFHSLSDKVGDKAVVGKKGAPAGAKGTVVIVFERDRFPDDAFKPVGWLEKNLVPTSPQERALKEWQALKGLYLSGMGHKAPLVAQKK